MWMNKKWLAVLVPTILLAAGCLILTAGNRKVELPQEVLDFTGGNIPDLPLVIIESDSGEDPTYTSVEAPEDCYGASITDNDYIHGTIRYLEKGRLSMTDGVNFRIRGNTTAQVEKKPYKLQLDHDWDFFHRNESRYMEKDWILLSMSCNLNMAIGAGLADLLDEEWVPAYEYVNVIVNGDWKGCYALCESVKKSPGRIDINDDGFIVESDAYFYTQDRSRYFKTDYPVYAMAYTFKYPRPETMSDDRIQQIRDYFNEYETALYEGDRYLEYIDPECFVNWVMVHDLLGTWDSNGSNIYYYKKSLSPGDRTTSKLKIGPTWDYDSNFMNVDKWAGIHKEDIAHFDQLMAKPSFLNLYLNRWDEIAPTIAEDAIGIVEARVKRQGEALQLSWELDAKRYSRDPDPGVQERLEEIRNWMHSRTAWIGNKVEELR